MSILPLLLTSVSTECKQVLRGTPINMLLDCQVYILVNVLLVAVIFPEFVEFYIHNIQFYGKHAEYTQHTHTYI